MRRRIVFLLLIATCYFVSPTLYCPVLKAQQTGPNLSFYELEVKPNLYNRSMEARAELTFKGGGNHEKIELLLSSSMQVAQVFCGSEACDFNQRGDRIQIKLPTAWSTMSRPKLAITFAGEPGVATNPPWTPGLVWKLDHNDRTWSTSVPQKPNEASWFPYPAGDMADSSRVHITLPDRLMPVSNGYLLASEKTEKKRRLRHTYVQSSPIYPAELQLDIGYYQVYDTSILLGGQQELVVQHYVQDYQFKRAKRHFQQTADVYQAWYHYLGEAPAEPDTITLVEVPFAGSGGRGIITYGNRFMRGSYGGFIPRGMHWDHELVRSTAQQYALERFGYPSPEERWIKHGIVTHLECLYVEYHFGQVAAQEYRQIYRPYLRERQPLIDSLASDFDLYDGEFQAKSGLVLHTIRHGLEGRHNWLQFLKTWMQQPLQKGHETAALLSILAMDKTVNWSSILNQYLLDRRLPVLQLRQGYSYDEESYYIEAKFSCQQADFDLPLKMNYAGHTLEVQANAKEWIKVVSGEDMNPEALQLADPTILVEVEYLGWKAN